MKKISRFSMIAAMSIASGLPVGMIPGIASMTQKPAGPKVQTDTDHAAMAKAEAKRARRAGRAA